MSHKERDWLRSEIHTLQALLDELPESEIIERIGFEHRLATARERLAALEETTPPKPLTVTFRGAPVEGSRSIVAGFAADAMRAFIDAAETVAASMTTELKDSGRLPSTGERSLRILDTALGSFGFELELPAAEPAQGALALGDGEPDPYERAIEATLDLMDDAIRSDEEGLSDLVAEIHPRAAKKVLAFAKVLLDNDAQAAATFGERRLRLESEREVRRVVDALKDEDIEEDEIEETGVLLGVLPESRRFECRLGDGRLITGKLDRAITDVGELKRSVEDREARLKFREVRVRTNTRYSLLAATPLSDAAD